MYSIPCITLEEFGQNNKRIQQLKKIMFELKHIACYLDVCRDKKELLDTIYCEYRHWMKDAAQGRISLRDCVNILSFDTADKLQVLSNKFQKHICVDCDMCRGKGYYCEICNDMQQVIYPFQYQQVEQCNVCNACFHTKCWQKVSNHCPRCKRRQNHTKIIN
eukprot:275748_1